MKIKMKVKIFIFIQLVVIAGLSFGAKINWRTSRKYEYTSESVVIYHIVYS